MIGGLKDLKIYVDLALLSVEGDEPVARVTRLHSAAIGYSAVIFGSMNGEFEMMRNWKIVWENLEKDIYLHCKLVRVLVFYVIFICTDKMRYNEVE